MKIRVGGEKHVAFCATFQKPIILPYPSTSSPCKEEHPRVQIQVALIIIYVKSTWIIIQTTRQTMCSCSTKPSITWLWMWGFLTSFQEGIPRGQSWKCSSSKRLHHLSGMKRAEKKRWLSRWQIYSKYRKNNLWLRKHNFKNKQLWSIIRFYY